VLFNIQHLADMANIAAHWLLQLTCPTKWRRRSPSPYTERCHWKRKRMFILSYTQKTVSTTSSSPGHEIH